MKRLFLALIAFAPFGVFALPAVAHAALPTPPAILEWDSTVRGWDDSTYWYDTDGNRYAFTSRASYQSWFPGSPTGVSKAGIPDLATAKLAGAVFNRPGVRLVKFQSSPDVYAVSRYGVLRKIATEQVAMELYGEAWTSFIDELSVTDYPLYTFGATITDAAEYDVHAHDNLTNPSTNVVNADNHAPEKFDATISLAADRAYATVGSTFKLTSYLSKTEGSWHNFTLRFYDQMGAMVGECKTTLSCTVTVNVGGPVGTQTFIARGFNQWEQAVESTPVTVIVSNP
jgi:hypothetical protein